MQSKTTGPFTPSGLWINYDNYAECKHKDHLSTRKCCTILIAIHKFAQFIYITCIKSPTYSMYTIYSMSMFTHSRVNTVCFILGIHFIWCMLQFVKSHLWFSTIIPLPLDVLHLDGTLGQIIDSICIRHHQVIADNVIVTFM